ncbi:DUF3284 domain-containing protein [Alkalibacterium kapii]|uniref:DUF3284 domain-containing protein n=1 Tax=Alkalibacterium kapii TaxID=426704 RepID=A0A511AXY9_9LACT|nr:DUF3284 domain-containing protein [Alkalibacterium kapii]GEK92001.1 hypothetical protein AKA01nite_16230 [Alkalibacterium kapii]
MKTTSTLDVSQEAFFDFLYLSIINDIKQSTQKNVSKDDITEGFEYKKTLANKMGRKGQVKVTLAELQPPTKYVAEFKSNQGINVISYEIESVNESQIKVTYTEEFIAADKLKDWNFKLLNFFYKKKSKKTIDATLKNIETYIKTKREEA